MKKVFASVLSLLGLSRPGVQGQQVQMIDPNKILFSVPTLTNELPPVEEVEGPLPDATLFCHEDDWCQVEFFPQARLSEVQQILKEYKEFEAANREEYGWKDVYVRRIQRSPVLTGGDAVDRLESLVTFKAEPGPVLQSSRALTGRVVNGFSMSLGGNIHLYGYSTIGGIPVLGAAVGANPDDLVLTRVFGQLNKAAGLVLVDWKQQLILTGVTSNGAIEVWRP